MFICLGALTNYFYLCTVKTLLTTLIYLIMKIFKILAIAAAAFVSVSVAKAQDLTDDYTRVYAGYHNFGFKDADFTQSGFIIGGEYNLNVTNHEQPLFLGAGLEYQYTTHSENSVSQTFQALSIPVNVSYKFGNEQFQVSPYIGQSFRFGLSHKIDGGGKTINLYDDNDNHRFQLMLNLGINFEYNKFSLGYRYQLSETKMGSDHDGYKANPDYNHSITVGYSF